MSCSVSLELLMIANDLMFYNMVTRLNLWFNWGFLVGMSISIQLVSGLLLACYYDSSFDLAYDSIQFLYSEVQSMWSVSFIHVNIANAVFAYLYLHIFKNISMASIRSHKSLVWIMGLVMVFLLLLVGFTGYSLVLGQMSYWALTVISNLVTCIPGGYDLLYYIWGDTYISSLAMNSFYLMHLPLMVALIMTHFLASHEYFWRTHGPWNWDSS